MLLLFCSFRCMCSYKDVLFLLSTSFFFSIVDKGKKIELMYNCVCVRERKFPWPCSKHYLQVQEKKKEKKKRIRQTDDSFLLLSFSLSLFLSNDTPCKLHALCAWVCMIILSSLDRKTFPHFFFHHWSLFFFFSSLPLLAHTIVLLPSNL